MNELMIFSLKFYILFIQWKNITYNKESESFAKSEV